MPRACSETLVKAEDLVKSQKEKEKKKACWEMKIMVSKANEKTHKDARKIFQPKSE